MLLILMLALAVSAVAYWISRGVLNFNDDFGWGTPIVSQEGAEEFLGSVERLFEPVLAGYLRENRKYVTLAVGCTGGKHRSVAMAEALSARLSSDTVETFVVHRDLGQE